MIRPRALAVLLAGACALLSGCVSIPGGGPVVPGNKVEVAAPPGDANLPQGPLPGDGPGQLIRGFLLASAAFADDHGVAREFLQPSPGPRLGWRPDVSVVIYPGYEDWGISVTRHGVTEQDPAASRPVPSTSATPSRTAAKGGSVKAGSARSGSARSGSAQSGPGKSGSARSGSGRSGSTGASSTRAPVAPVPVPVPTSSPPALGEVASVTVRVPVTARIDVNGQYTVSPPGDVETRVFDLIGTEEGWRISRLGSGILISQTDFLNVFREFPVYFSDQAGRYLVPDVRWFPATRSTAASIPATLVSALLGPPAAWLVPGVVSGAPAGTRTTVNGVKVVDGTATVDLTIAARNTGPAKRLILKGQLDATLTGLDPTIQVINSVAVTVEQQVFEMQASTPAANDVPGAVDASSEPLPPPSPVDSSLVGIDPKGAVVRLVGGRTVTPVKGLAALASPTNSFPAAERGGDAYALLAGNRSRLVYAVPSGPATVLMVGHDLLPPTFDPYGWVWSAQAQSWGVLLAGQPGAGVARVRAPWLDGARLRSLRISAEGARALLALQRADGSTEAVVAAVVRDAKGRPLALGSPLRVLADAQDVTSAAWVGATSVAVLARRPGQPATPWIVEIGGDVHSEPPPPIQGVSVTAGESEWDLYVTLPNGTVQTRVGSSWEPVPGVRWPSMPG